MKIDEICLNFNNSLKQALVMIKDTGIRCIIIVNDEGKMIGTLSEGDIIDGILKGKSLFSPLKMFFNRNFIYSLDGKKLISGSSIIEKIKKWYFNNPNFELRGCSTDFIDYRDYIK